MIEKKFLIVGNWKMNANALEAAAISKQLLPYKAMLEKYDLQIKVVISPPFPFISLVKDLVVELKIALGAQDCHEQEQGAFTGDVSARMLASLGCQYIILGHSERRRFHHETNQLVSMKVATCVKHNLIPIICIGETEEEKNQGQTFKILNRQLEECLPKEKLAGKSFVVAYEPVWAIGSGKIPEDKEISFIHQHIYQYLLKFSSNQLFSVIYGGSVKPENAGLIAGLKRVDGLLVGGVSLQADNFVEVIKKSSMSLSQFDMQA